MKFNTKVIFSSEYEAVKDLSDLERSHGYGVYFYFRGVRLDGVIDVRMSGSDFVAFSCIARGAAHDVDGYNARVETYKMDEVTVLRRIAPNGPPQILDFA